MPVLTFYRQGRQDGGIRTGIEIDRYAVLGRLEGGEEFAFNPLLTWYVDVECAGEGLPGRPEEVRRWFLAQAAAIRRGLGSVAEDVDAGLDPGARPYRRECPGGPPGVTIAIICFANRRYEAQRMAETLREVAGRWEEIIRDLPALQPATT